MAKRQSRTKKKNKSRPRSYNEHLENLFRILDVVAVEDSSKTLNSYRLMDDDNINVNHCIHSENSSHQHSNQIVNLFWTAITEVQLHSEPRFYGLPPGKEMSVISSDDLSLLRPDTKAWGEMRNRCLATSDSSILLGLSPYKNVSSFNTALDCMVLSPPHALVPRLHLPVTPPFRTVDFAPCSFEFLHSLSDPNSSASSLPFDPFYPFPHPSYPLRCVLRRFPLSLKAMTSQHISDLNLKQSQETEVAVDKSRFNADEYNICLPLSPPSSFPPPPPQPSTRLIQMAKEAATRNEFKDKESNIACLSSSQNSSYREDVSRNVPSDPPPLFPPPLPLSFLIPLQMKNKQASPEEANNAAILSYKQKLFCEYEQLQQDEAFISSCGCESVNSGLPLKSESSFSPHFISNNNDNDNDNSKNIASILLARRYMEDNADRLAEDVALYGDASTVRTKYGKTQEPASLENVLRVFPLTTLHQVGRYYASQHEIPLPLAEEMKADTARNRLARLLLLALKEEEEEEEEEEREEEKEENEVEEEEEEEKKDGENDERKAGTGNNEKKEKGINEVERREENIKSDEETYDVRSSKYFTNNEKESDNDASASVGLKKSIIPTKSFMKLVVDLIDDFTLSERSKSLTASSPTSSSSSRATTAFDSKISPPRAPLSYRAALRRLILDTIQRHVVSSIRGGGSGFMSALVNLSASLDEEWLTDYVFESGLNLSVTARGDDDEEEEEEEEEEDDDDFGKDLEHEKEGSEEELIEKGGLAKKGEKLKASGTNEQSCSKIASTREADAADMMRRLELNEAQESVPLCRTGSTKADQGYGAWSGSKEGASGEGAETREGGEERLVRNEREFGVEEEDRRQAFQSDSLHLNQQDHRHYHVINTSPPLSPSLSPTQEARKEAIRAQVNFLLKPLKKKMGSLLEKYEIYGYWDASKWVHFKAYFENLDEQKLINLNSYSGEGTLWDLWGEEGDLIGLSHMFCDVGDGLEGNYVSRDGTMCTATHFGDYSSLWILDRSLEIEEEIEKGASTMDGDPSSVMSTTVPGSGSRCDDGDDDDSLNDLIPADPRIRNSLRSKITPPDYATDASPVLAIALKSLALCTREYDKRKKEEEDERKEKERDNNNNSNNNNNNNNNKMIKKKGINKKKKFKTKARREEILLKNYHLGLCMPLPSLGATPDAVACHHLILSDPEMAELDRAWRRLRCAKLDLILPAREREDLRRREREGGVGHGREDALDEGEGGVSEVGTSDEWTRLIRGLELAEVAENEFQSLIRGMCKSVLTWQDPRFLSLFVPPPPSSTSPHPPFSTPPPSPSLHPHLRCESLGAIFESLESASLTLKPFCPSSFTITPPSHDASSSNLPAVNIVQAPVPVFAIEPFTISPLDGPHSHGDKGGRIVEKDANGDRADNAEDILPRPPLMHRLVGGVRGSQTVGRKGDHRPHNHQLPSHRPTTTNGQRLIEVDANGHVLLPCPPPPSLHSSPSSPLPPLPTSPYPPLNRPAQPVQAWHVAFREAVEVKNTSPFVFREFGWSSRKPSALPIFNIYLSCFDGMFRKLSSLVSQANLLTERKGWLENQASITRKQMEHESELPGSYHVTGVPSLDSPSKAQTETKREEQGGVQSKAASLSTTLSRPSLLPPPPSLPSPSSLPPCTATKRSKQVVQMDENLQHFLVPMYYGGLTEFSTKMRTETKTEGKTNASSSPPPYKCPQTRFPLLSSTSSAKFCNAAYGIFLSELDPSRKLRGEKGNEEEEGEEEENSSNLSQFSIRSNYSIGHKEVHIPNNTVDHSDCNNKNTKKKKDNNNPYPKKDSKENNQRTGSKSTSSSTNTAAAAYAVKRPYKNQYARFRRILPNAVVDSMYRSSSLRYLGAGRSPPYETAVRPFWIPQIQMHMLTTNTWSCLVAIRSMHQGITVFRVHRDVSYIRYMLKAFSALHVWIQSALALSLAEIRDAMLQVAAEAPTAAIVEAAGAEARVEGWKRLKGEADGGGKDSGRNGMKGEKEEKKNEKDALLTKSKVNNDNNNNKDKDNEDCSSCEDMPNGSNVELARKIFVKLTSEFHSREEASKNGAEDNKSSPNDEEANKTRKLRLKKNEILTALIDYLELPSDILDTIASYDEEKDEIVERSNRYSNKSDCDTIKRMLLDRKKNLKSYNKAAPIETTIDWNVTGNRQCSIRDEKQNYISKIPLHKIKEKDFDEFRSRCSHLFTHLASESTHMAISAECIYNGKISSSMSFNAAETVHREKKRYFKLVDERIYRERTAKGKQISNGANAAFKTTELDVSHEELQGLPILRLSTPEALHSILPHQFSNQKAFYELAKDKHKSKSDV